MLQRVRLVTGEAKREESHKNLSSAIYEANTDGERGKKLMLISLFDYLSALGSVELAATSSWMRCYGKSRPGMTTHSPYLLLVDSALSTVSHFMKVSEIMTYN